MEEKENWLYHKAIQTYGKDAQVDIAIEECSELIKALLKNRRGTDNRQDIIEELADVQIMLEQLKIIFDINEFEITTHKDYKHRRLRKRLEEANGEAESVYPDKEVTEEEG